MWIMIAGPYRSGSSDPAVWAENHRKLNAVALAVFQKGHTPIVGVNLALPIIESAGQGSVQPDHAAVVLAPGGAMRRGSED